MKYYAAILLFILCLYSCSNDDDNVVERISPTVRGMGFSQSENSFDETYGNIQSSLNSSGISIMAEVDHAANARSIDLDLPDTKLIIFGNPELGTPLIQENQLAALDLPQKILIYQEGEVVLATYNTIAYLASRHDLNVEGEELQKINAALTDVIVNGTNVVPSQPDEATVANKEGIITVASNQPFNATYTALKTAIETNENLNIVAEIDHKANGARVNKIIRDTRLIIFGNPSLGTPLIQGSQSVAIDLPQKMLVWQDDTGIINISYNDPEFLVKRHKIRGFSEIIETISATLEDLSVTAAN